jgi:hypothetical protein
MKLRKARYLSRFTEVAGKGQEAFHRDREWSESKSRVLEFEDIYCIGESVFAGWIGPRNNVRRSSEVRKSTIPLRIVLSISLRNPDKRRYRVDDLYRD